LSMEEFEWIPYSVSGPFLCTSNPFHCCPVYNRNFTPLKYLPQLQVTTQRPSSSSPDMHPPKTSGRPPAILL
jgi:hypothetical protein